MEAACIGLQQNTYTLFAKTVSGQSVYGYETSAKCREAAENVCYNQHTASVVTSNGKYLIKGNNKSFVDLRSVKHAIASMNGLRAADNMTSYKVSERVGVDNFKIANDSLSKIQTAINKVSSQRSALGALQNRLEHTIANLNTTSENTSASESKLRDTDMASEMVNFSKNNILAQAGQSMLAQANQSTQGVLSLLG
jgi:flagellin